MMERSVQQRRSELAQSLRQALEAADADQQAALHAALRQLWQGKLPPQAVSAAIDGPRDAELHAAQAELDAAWSVFHERFEAAALETSQAIARLASDQRLREAITWQNRNALRHSVDSLLKMPESLRNAERRKREALIARYAQRYCAKNDTIGFFGPVGWASVGDSAAPIEVRAGAALLAKRTVYFESWGVDALAAVLNQDGALQPWLKPRRSPLIHIEHGQGLLPGRPPLQLPAPLIVLLQACDGSRTARELAAQITAMPASGLRSEAEVYSVLAQLRDQSLLTWRLELPTEIAADQRLRQVLDEIDDRPLRERALELLDRLCAVRDRVAAAAGDAEQLDRAMAELDDTFTAITSAEPTRAPGQMYAARTLVYEDCVRDVSVELGGALLAELGPPLALLLASGRWFTAEAATLYRAVFRQLYDALRQQLGSPTIDMAIFWNEIEPALFRDTGGVLARLTQLLQQRWSEVLALPSDVHQVSYSSAELRPHVAAAFAADRPGWQTASYHSPDVLIAASSIDAICAGDYQLVLGEFHVGANTLRAGCFAMQHPAPDELLAALDRDLPQPRAIPIVPKSWARFTARTNIVFITPKDIRLELAPLPTGVTPEHILPISALVVDERDGELIVRTRDGQTSLEIIEVFAEALTMLTVGTFKPLRPEPHTPRVTIDRLVIARETWRCEPQTIPFADERDDARRFVAARRWAQALDMPRRVFVKAPAEQKPVYLDFDSPIAVDACAKLIRQTAAQGNAALIFSEMLPDPEQTWLPDAAGARYTSELRIVAVDRSAATG